MGAIDLSFWAPLATLLILAGGVAGVLAGLFGIGGGAIFVPVLYQAFGAIGVSQSVSIHLAIGSSLAIIIPTSIRSLVSHWKVGLVDAKLLREWIVFVPLGAALGGAVAASVSSGALRAIFAAIALLVATKLIVGRIPFTLGRDLPSWPWRSLAGGLIGLLSSLMGIGGGVLNNTFMTLFGRDMHQAIATSAGVGVLIAIPGFIAYLVGGWGHPDLPLGSIGYVNLLALAVVAPVSSLTAPLGARLAHRLTKRQLELGFGLFLTVVAVRFIWSLL